MTTTAEAANPPDAYRRRYWCLAVTCIALTVIGCALTILNVAIPALNRELGADAEDLQWIFAAYGLVFSGLVVTGGLRAAVIAGIVVLVLTATAILAMLPHTRHVRRWHRTGILGRPHHQPAPALVGGFHER